MSEALATSLETLQSGGRLRGAALDSAFATIMDGFATHDQIKAFLIGMIPQMNDPEALVAGARALRDRMVKVWAPDDAIDVCGTGGDGAHTLNISTAASFVIAGCGVPVAKHGNRAMSSKSGAADVLEALGVRLTAEPAILRLALENARIAFLFAQNHHPAMRHVAAARKELGRRTIFNLLGPLSNPAGVTRQLVGVFAPEFVGPVRDALAALGAARAMVVHGAGGLDELTCAGANQVAMFDRHGAHDACKGNALSVSATTFDAAPITIDDIRGGDASFNAAALRTLLSGQEIVGPYGRTVLLNAAGGLIAAGRVANWEAGISLARESLEEGRAMEALRSLIAITNEARQ